MVQKIGSRRNPFKYDVIHVLHFLVLDISLMIGLSCWWEGKKKFYGNECFFWLHLGSIVSFLSGLSHESVKWLCVVSAYSLKWISKSGSLQKKETLVKSSSRLIRCFWEGGFPLSWNSISFLGTKKICEAKIVVILTDTGSGGVLFQIINFVFKFYFKRPSARQMRHVSTDVGDSFAIFRLYAATLWSPPTVVCEPLLV